MKQTVTRMTFLWVIISSLMLLPSTSFAIDLFNTETGVLVIPEVDVNGDTFYDNVSLKLDFATGKFELISADTKPETISITPMDTMEDQDIKMDLMGCTRSGRNKVSCHMKLTSLGGFDRNTTIYAAYSSNSHSYLFDDLGNTYSAQEVTIGNQTTSSRIVVNLIAGVPTLAIFEFVGISPNASSISLFQPLFDISGVSGGFTGDFRNIDF